jgi:predicted DsbA family dithiol-disulfide isomerase
MKRLRVKTFIDYICPFSFLLHLKIERLKKELPLNDEWYPILSHPEIPDDGITLEKLIPDDELRSDAIESATILAEQEGINLNLPDRVSSSKMAIWMSECARQNGQFKEYNRKVYKAYFQEGKDIGDDQTIPEIMKNLKIPSSNVISFIKDRTGYGKAISKRVIECRERKISKVPTMLVGDLKIEGAWPYSLLRQTVASLLETG